MHVYYEQDTGRIALVSSMPHINPKGYPVLEHVEIDVSQIAAHYVANGAVVTKPPRPSDHHEWDYGLRAWVDARSAQQVLSDLDANARAQRDALLASCDWRVLRAIDRGQPIDEAWSVYRQALRDITDQTGYPLEIRWPAAPGV